MTALEISHIAIDGHKAPYDLRIELRGKITEAVDDGIVQRMHDQEAALAAATAAARWEIAEVFGKVILDYAINTADFDLDLDCRKRK